MNSIFNFIKTLWRNRDSDLTFLLYDDRSAEESSKTFLLRPRKLFRLTWFAGLFLVVVVTLAIAFTPLKTLIVPGAEPGIRKQIVRISRRVQALEDTLQMRERQLQNMKQVMLQEKDTMFNISESAIEPSHPMPTRVRNVTMDKFYTPLTPNELASKSDIIYSSQTNMGPEFPVPYPVDGTLSQGMDRSSKHFGIDIATESGATVRAIADGRIIGSSWTPTFGYVVRIQHGNGYVSVYKHCLSLLHDQGDVVRQGDIIGRVGDVGVLSSGPHLHFELWRQGIPLNPKHFLVNN